MQRQLGRDVVAPVRVERRHHVRDAAVPARARGGCDVLVHQRLDQVVAERVVEAAARAALGDDAAIDQLAQRVEHGSFEPTGRLAQELDVETAADDRRHLRQRLRRVAQPGQTCGQHAAQCRGYAARGLVERPAAGAVVQPSGLAEVAQDLFEEERVPVAAVVQRARQLGGIIDLAERAHERFDVLATEPRQRHVRRGPFAFEAPPQGAQLMRRFELVFAVGGDEQHAAAHAAA